MDKSSVVFEMSSIVIGLLSDTKAFDWLLLANIIYIGHQFVFWAISCSTSHLVSSWFR